MKQSMRLLAATIITLLLASSARAQDISGDWQGTIHWGNGLRQILHIAKSGNGDWAARLYSIDQTPDAIPVDIVTLQGSTLKFTISDIHGSYEGKLSADGTSISGAWSQGETIALDFQRVTKETEWPRDTSSHTVQFITVDNDVKLEVLDWGGIGRPIVLLAGLGSTAHIFDKFAPKLTASYHVYGITRRGFGESSAPVPTSANYSADRLGDDVLAVLDVLKLKHPVLVGHSIAGEELSSLASRHPERVAGLIYLEAGYPYAYYDRAKGDLALDSRELERKLEEAQPAKGRPDQKQLLQELLQAIIPQVEKELQQRLKDLEAFPIPASATPPASSQQEIRQAILAGEQKYTDIHLPVLAIYALPHDLGSAFQDNPAMRAAAEARDLERTGEQAKALEAGISSARVVRIPHASHAIFKSNETDVLREMNAFLGSLP